MPAVVWPAQGTILAVDETTSGTYTTITGLTSIDGIGGETTAQVDSTALSASVKTYRSSIPDPGDVSAEMNYDPTDAVHKFLATQADSANPAALSYKATYNTGTTTSTVVFNANISEFPGASASGVDENLTSGFTLKRTGTLTRVP